MTQIDVLVQELDEFVAKGKPSSIFGFVDSLDALILILKDIQQLIGMVKFKNFVATQFQAFAISYNETGSPLKNDMLNVMFYGPPGVGKTICGGLLGRFWLACGCLKSTSAPAPKQTKEPNIITLNPDVKIPRHVTNSEQENYRLKKKINRLAVSSLEAKRELNRLRKSAGNHPQIQIQFAKIKSFLHDIENSREKIVLPGLIPSKATEIETLREEIKLPQRPLTSRASSPSSASSKVNEGVFAIYTRADFIGEFQGSSTKRFRDIVADNMGKVIMIDEAYSMLVDEKDTFGKEVITEIINFMDKNPKDIRWIFAGYKEDIQNNLMKLQPGLHRRFNWYIEIDPYTIEELALIYRHQMKQRGWTCTDKQFQAITESFKKSPPELFKDYGGSTQKLCHLFETIKSGEKWQNLISGSELPSDKTFTVRDVKKAIQKLQETSEAPGQGDKGPPEGWYA